MPNNLQSLKLRLGLFFHLILMFLSRDNLIDISKVSIDKGVGLQNTSDFLFPSLSLYGILYVKIIITNVEHQSDSRIIPSLKRL